MLAAPSLRDLSRRLREGKVSAEQVTRSYLDRVEEREPEVQAWAWLEPERALEEARSVDAMPNKGPLHGIPVGIKDVIDTADMPTAYGSPIYDGYRPAADAASVAGIRTAGGVILGKAVTCEFAGGLPSKTRNPHNPAHTPGGSSAGSAAAVAAGMVPVTLGTQTAGSILRPASFCGVVGYKPTYGLINRAGVKPLAESFDTVGMFAATVDDAGWFAAGLTGQADLADDTPLDRPIRLLLCRTDKWPVADADGQATLEEAASRLAQAGADVVEGDLPFSCGSLMATGLAILTVDAARAFGHERRHANELLSDTMRKFLAPAETYDGARYRQAQVELLGVRETFDAFLEGYDALVTLSAPGEAPEGFGSTGNATFNVPWTFLHAPALSVPGLTGGRGLPVGVQLVGRRFDDAALLRVGRWVQSQLGA